MENKTICVNESNSKNYNAIDLMKFILAFFVCLIHIPLFNEESFELARSFNFVCRQYFCRLAVPFYFVTAGFFLFKNTDLNKIDSTRIKNYCFKIWRLFGLWTVLCVVGGRYHIWYLCSLPVAVLVLYFLLKSKIKTRNIIIIACFLYFIGVLGNSHYAVVSRLNEVSFFRSVTKVFETVFTTTRNGIFMGFPYVLMGMLFAKKKININIKLAYFCFVVSMAALFAEVYYIKFYASPKAYDFYFTLVPAVFFLFYIVLHINLKDRKIYPKLRSLSFLIYVLHVLVWYFVDLAIAAIKNASGADLSDFTFFIAVIMTVLISVLIEKLSGKKSFGWLRYLYS